MEYLDVLDENGRFTGRAESRKKIHEDGLWHRVVHIWIINSKGEVLMQKRSAQKSSDPNMWAMACEGHVPAGKEIFETVLCELREELGLEIENNEIQFLYNYKSSYIKNDGLYKGNHFIEVYLIKKDLDVDKLVLQEEEVAEVKWMKIEELEESVQRKDPSFKTYSGEYPEIFKWFK